MTAIRACLLAFCIALFAPVGSTFARAPETSLRPVPRQEAAPLVRPAANVPGPAISLRPLARPSGLVVRYEDNRNVAPSQKKLTREERRLLRKGAICGDPEIQGTAIGRVPGKIAGCGIADAVRVRSVAGVSLSQEAVLDCATVQALKQWVTKGMRPAMRRQGEVVQLRVAAHYTCRTRNSRPGAPVSEHGKGKAIDISGFRMSDGRVVSVLNGWTDRRTSRAMRQMHKAACGPFGTVLGPDADRFHRDHFHFDTARHRSGPYCR